METLRPTEMRSDTLAPTSPRRIGAHRSALGWTGVGFVAGVLFWNVVSFVPGAGLVIRDAHVSGVITGSVGKSTDKPPASEIANVSGASGVNCVTLALDRRDQVTRALPCEHHHDLRHSDESGREDFASLDNGFAHSIARAIEQSTTASD